MATISLSPPPVREPISGRDGLVSAIWVKWFTEFYMRIGGAISLTPDDVGVLATYTENVQTGAPDKNAGLDALFLNSASKRLEIDDSLAFLSMQRPSQAQDDSAAFDTPLRPLPPLDDSLVFSDIHDPFRAHYVTGIWTPVLTFATPGDLSVSYSLQAGDYIKIGSLVIANFAIATSAFTFTTATGNLKITGAPYPNDMATNLQADGALAWGGITKTNYTQVCAQINTGGTDIFFVASGSGQAQSIVSASDTPTGGTVVLRGCLAYKT